jgi:hypothetical protein
LAALLEANETLLEALRVYNDLERVANEKQAKERSTVDARTKSVVSQRLECYWSFPSLNFVQDIRSRIEGSDRAFSGEVGESLPSRPSSTSSGSAMSDYTSSLLPRFPPSLDTVGAAKAALAQSLAPPPHAPHGPRSTAQMSLSSRPTSPVTANQLSRSSSICSSEEVDVAAIENSRVENEVQSSVYEQPSAKALGKRKVIEAEELNGMFQFL